jgi:homocysteine S-methyltransferase
MGSDLSKIISRSAELGSKGVLCINLPDGPRASSRVSCVANRDRELKEKQKIETIPHICCRDKNLIGIQAELLGFQAAGLQKPSDNNRDPPRLGTTLTLRGFWMSIQ